MGDAMEAITDVVNELHVRMSGEDIKINMAHKVERGGSVGRAKLGYLNVRKDFDGRLVNTIDVDPERAPLIKWAFEQYASGQYSVTQLQMLLEDQGLTTRASSKRPARPLSSSALAKILRDPYYTGVIRSKGRLYPGRHAPIISKELFLAVQKVLDGRNRRGDRDRTHFHFLRGLLFCEQCERDGRTSRLVYSQNTGRGGTYEYYVCTAKQRGLCTMRTVRLEEVEAAVAKAVAAQRFAPTSIDDIRVEVRRALDEMQALDQEERSSLRTRLQQLEEQEERLIELAVEGSIASPKLRERLDHVTMQKGSIEEALARTDERIQRGVDRVFEFVDLLAEPRTLYDEIPSHGKRELLGAFFDKIRVLVTEDGVAIDVERTEVNETLHEWRAQHDLGVTTQPSTSANEKRASRVSTKGPLSRPHRPIQSIGLNRPVLVGLTGFEPATP